MRDEEREKQLAGAGRDGVKTVATPLEISAPGRKDDTRGASRASTRTAFMEDRQRFLSTEDFQATWRTYSDRGRESRFAAHFQKKYRSVRLSI